MPGDRRQTNRKLHFDINLTSFDVRQIFIIAFIQSNWMRYPDSLGIDHYSAFSRENDFIDIV